MPFPGLSANFNEPQSDDTTSTPPMPDQQPTQQPTVASHSPRHCPNGKRPASSAQPSNSLANSRQLLPELGEGGLVRKSLASRNGKPRR